MALLPTFRREAMLGLFGEPLFDEASARELLMQVGPLPGAVDLTEAMAVSLSELGKSVAFDLWNEVQATSSERAKEARRLAAACSKVLSITGVGDGGELLPMFGRGGLFAAAHIRGEPRGEAATMNALRAVDTLRQDALKMLEIESKRRRMKSPKAGRPEVKALRRLVVELSCLYETVWRQPPGVSTGDRAEPCGPLMRLMLNVVQRLKLRGIRINASADSLRAIWRRVADEEKMPETHLMRQAGLVDKASCTPSK